MTRLLFAVSSSWRYSEIMRWIACLLVMLTAPLCAQDFEWVMNSYVTVGEDESVYVTRGERTYIGSVVDEKDGTFWAMGKNGSSVFGTRNGDQLILLKSPAGDND